MGVYININNHFPFSVHCEGIEAGQVTINTPSTKNLISKYHSPLKKTRVSLRNIHSQRWERENT
jgi:hypothetical protein